MTETQAAVLPIKKKEKVVRLRVSQILPSDVVDVYRLVASSAKEFPHAYPGLETTNRDEVMMHLYNFISAPNFLGVMLRSGKKPVGMIICQEQHRPILAPTRFLFVWSFYIDPEVRKTGALKLLATECAKAARARGLESWESNSDDKTAEFISAITKGKSKILYKRVSCSF